MTAFTRSASRSATLATVIADALEDERERRYGAASALWGAIADAAARADSLARLESALALAGGLLTHPTGGDSP